MGGYFTRARYLRDQSAAELETRLGYRTGRLREGWWLLFLEQQPRPNDFEFRAYTHWSGGVAGGHDPATTDRRTAERRLADGGVDLARLKAEFAPAFAVRGTERLAKVIPKAGAYGRDDYPSGSGFPQWELVQPLIFRVVAFVGPGRTYTGNYV